MPLTGRTAVVTGGGRGIGAAVARRLVTLRCRVLVSARTTEEIEAVADELRATGGEAAAESCNVADETSVERLAAAARERLGHVDILINNAGTASSAPLARTTLTDWNRLFAVNATGAFLCTRAFLPAMLERGWGRVVNLASVAGLRGARYIAAYTAAKHALVGLTRATAAEVAGTGVTANAVCPGYVDTPMTDESVRRIMERTGKSREDAVAAMLGTNRQPRLVTGEEVAFAVGVLCTPEAGAINGETIVLDGGGLIP